MSFRCLSCLVLVLLAANGPLRGEGVLRVCADPNNLPFSNQQGQGLENKLADLLAVSLNERLEYVWWSQRKGFAKQSLNAGSCDLVLGVPASMPDVLTTAAYYRSAYVFVSRADRHLGLISLGDPRLAELRIGMHVAGDDYAPPAYALARRGITGNITGFSLFGAYGEADPGRKLLDAVDRGDVDVAIVWGPIAGYFARQEPDALEIAPVSPLEMAGVPFAYDISAAVRRGNEALKADLDKALAERVSEIQKLLEEYSVPVTK
jgi:mxaJ protein